MVEIKYEISATMEPKSVKDLTDEEKKIIPIPNHSKLAEIILQKLDEFTPSDETTTLIVAWDGELKVIFSSNFNVTAYEKWRATDVEITL